MLVGSDPKPTDLATEENDEKDETFDSDGIIDFFVTARVMQDDKRRGRIKSFSLFFLISL